MESERPSQSRLRPQDSEQLIRTVAKEARPMASRRRSRSTKPGAKDVPSVKSTVEYGGGFFVGSPEATALWERRRREIAKDVLKRAAGRSVLRERRREGGPCLLLGPVTGEDARYWFFEGRGPTDRMGKDHPDAHDAPCAHCPDFKGS
jgi:hypothetical protein